MNSQISPASFNFESNTTIRAVIIDGNPWFIAMDVCKAVGISNNRDALLKLDDDEKNTVGLTDGNRGNPNTLIISESGLYTLILRCRDAVTPGTIPYRFRKWVTSEVLPQIRQTGKYEHQRPETLGDLAGTSGRELAVADKASQVVQSFMPAILEAMKQQEQKYCYPAKPGYRDFIHSPEGVASLADRSYLMELLRSLEENGNDVGGAVIEFTTMVNYISSTYRCIREIQSHAEYIVKQVKAH